MDHEHETSRPSESPHDEETPQPWYAKTTSRRGFVADVARVGGLALLHFTVLGALAGPALAGCEDDGCTCGGDQGVLDVCNCPNEEPGGTLKDYCECSDDPGLADECGCTDDTDGVDYCVCGYETQLTDRCDCDEDQNAADKCDCGTESVQTDACYCIPDQAMADKCDCGNEGAVADYCACGPDQNVADKCDCETESSSVDYCACGPDQNVADKCDCGNEGAVADYCACSADTQVADKCTCGLDEDGVTGSADYCGCAQDTQYESDTCTGDDPTPGDHKNPENAAADVCTCPPETPPTDTCQCWYDGRVDEPWYGSGADYCECDEDRSGTQDNCACCGDAPLEPGGPQADACDCGEDKGSWCKPEGGYPAFADWCNGPVAADICKCESNDFNTSEDPSHEWTQADYCQTSAKGITQDECTCGNEGGADGDGSGGSDYCTRDCYEDFDQKQDACSCGTDTNWSDEGNEHGNDACMCTGEEGGGAATMHDCCSCSNDPDQAADYCCAESDDEGDYCCQDDATSDV